MENTVRYLKTFDVILEKLYGKEIIFHLKKDKCLIGGSFVIAVIKGKDWFDDVDIYTPPECPNLISYIENILGGVLYSSPDYTGESNEILKTLKYATPEKSINIIKTNFSKRETIGEYIASISDLTICTSYHDMFMTYIHPDVKENVAYPLNENSVDEPYLLKRRIRAVKYKHRGFNVTVTTFQKDEGMLQQITEYNKSQEQIAKLKMFRIVLAYKLNLRTDEYYIIYTAEKEKMSENFLHIMQHYTAFRPGVVEKKSLVITKRNFPQIKPWLKKYEIFASENGNIIFEWTVIINTNIHETFSEEQTDNPEEKI